MSTHQVPVIRIKLDPHPNADRLSVVHHKRFTVVVATNEWKDGDLAAYIEPDMVVPPEPQYEFLAPKYRVKAKKLRGVWSMGLLVPAPEGSKVGDDVMEQLNITRYLPPFQGESVNVSAIPHKAPPGLDVKYDVESWYKFGDVFKANEPVWVTEKIHGTNARFTFRFVDGVGTQFVGSRSRWLNEGEAVYWRILDKYPGIKNLCEMHPGCTLYGEIYGWIQDLRYGHAPGEVSFAAFDILGSDGLWEDFSVVRELCEAHKIPTVPVVGLLPYEEAEMERLADGQSYLCQDHIREGVVIRPWVERWDPTVGRVILKIVSNSYLEKS